PPAASNPVPASYRRRISQNRRIVHALGPSAARNIFPVWIRVGIPACVTTRHMLPIPAAQGRSTHPSTHCRQTPLPTEALLVPVGTQGGGASAAGLLRRCGHI